jgi:chemotaxis protein MotA
MRMRADRSPTESGNDESLGRWHWTSVAAVAGGGLLVVVVQALEGGALGPLLQLPAALIVIGGTCAATLVSYPPSAIRQAFRAAWRGFREDGEDLNALCAQLVTLSVHAHRGGPTAIDQQIQYVRDPFLRNGLTLVADGVPLDLLRDTLAVERLAEEAREDLPIRLLESAAGYAPTLGILGAVLGLMRLMENLPSPAALGRGIALAFVATVYGIAAANLLLLPVASRLRELAVARSRRRELITEALLDMHKRLNPRLVAQKARGFGNVPNVAEIARQIGNAVPTHRGALA